MMIMVASTSAPSMILMGALELMAGVSDGTELCHTCRRLRDASPTLRASALLALCKLMCLDAAFCDTNLQLVFTLLQNRCVLTTFTIQRRTIVRMPLFNVITEHHKHV